MRKDLLILTAVLIPLAFLIILVANNFSPKKALNQFISPTPYLTIPSNQDPHDTITLAPAASVNIEVLSPRGGDKIKPNFAVKGNARVFENVVSIRLTDSQGVILVETSTMANAPDVGQFGPFEKMLEFQTTDTEGTLEVFQYSAKDGSEIDKVRVPILFK